ncbi:MAG: SAM-dependent methyltransferase [Muribaculaceae bacterium]|nr:SAM-dependent methyltransferase [Muribaculaceae bacterium]
MEAKTALYMIPVPVSEGSLDYVIPKENFAIVSELKYFIVENIRTARRILKRMDSSINISDITFYELNNHTPEIEINLFLEPLRKGESMGVMSEAGCPGIADPGAQVVALAQRAGLRVVPLVGPSSILLSLMASGLNGQCFCFHGYLPVENKEREKTIKDLEIQSRRHNMTQIFIETPYRNAKMMESLLGVLSDSTKLCVASEVTSPERENIVTRTVKDWKRTGFLPGKYPTIFLFHSKDLK